MSCEDVEPTDDVRDAMDHNWGVFLDQGPRLTTRYRTYIEARDRAKKRVLVGGLGALGCGAMWFDEEPHHAKYPGYAEAPEIPSVPHWSVSAEKRPE